MEEDPSLTDKTSLQEVAEAIDVMAGDILKNSPRIYAKGNPVREMPRMASAIERATKHRHFEDARARAGIFEKYLELYQPAEENARAAKSVIVQRIHDITKSAD